MPDVILKQYLTDISKYPLLTADQEKRLLWILQNAATVVGDSIRPWRLKRRPKKCVSKSHQKATDASPKRLAMATAEGKAARDALVNANLRLVCSIAKRYKAKDYTLVDIISQGNVGLLKAIDLFELKKGTRLSTYAGWWIKQAIREASGPTKAFIHVPVRASEIHRGVFNELYNEQHKRGHSVPLDEIITKNKLSRRTRESVRATEAVANATFRRVDNLHGDDLLEEIPARPEFFDDYELDKIMTVLRPNQLRVLSLKYGLDGSGVKTLDEVGKIIGLTRERVRQIQAAAIAKLLKSCG